MFNFFRPKPKPQKIEPFPDFFERVTGTLFKSMPQWRKDGINDLFAYWTKHHADKDLRWLAYILATVYHETGAQMIPVREGFAKTDAQARAVVKSRPYGKVGKFGFVPYGRGRVQVTWDDNYDRIERLFKHPFTKNPDLLLDSRIDAEICIEGHIKGIFTGRKLEDYFNNAWEDPVNARRIINRLDKAEKIAGHYRAFMSALS